MWSQQLDQASIVRLKQMISRRYGKGLEVRQLMEVSEDAMSSDYYLKGHKLFIPIRYQSDYLGMAVLSDANDLVEDEIQNISHLARLVLEPTLYSWYLNRKEENLKNNAAGSPMADIQPVFIEPHIENNSPQHFVDDHSFFSNDAYSPEISEADETLEMNSNLIHLESSLLNRAKKIAYQIHDMTGRWAFASFHELQNTIDDVNDLIKLGPMTIFVDKAESLSPEQQKIIKQIQGTEYDKDRPLIIINSQLSLTDLQQQKNFDAELLAEMAVNIFEVDRAPLKSQELKEVLHIFLTKKA